MQETTNATDDGVLRGIELTKRGLFGECETVMTFRPTVLGAKQAATTFKALSEKHPNAGYELRALVSVPRPLVPDSDPSVDFEDGGSHPIYAPDMTGPEDGICAADVAAMGVANG